MRKKEFEELNLENGVKSGRIQDVLYNTTSK
jgi:hypothetical protein